MPISHNHSSVQTLQEHILLHQQRKQQMAPFLKVHYISWVPECKKKIAIFQTISLFSFLSTTFHLNYIL